VAPQPAEHPPSKAPLWHVLPHVSSVQMCTGVDAHRDLFMVKSLGCSGSAGTATTHSQEPGPGSPEHTCGRRRLNLAPALGRPTHVVGLHQKAATDSEHIFVEQV
jgi:hypothetical protein